MSIVQRDKVLSSYNGNIESVLVTDAGATYTNGLFVTLGGLAGQGREVKEATLATDASEDALLIDSPEVMYEAGKHLDDFVNEEDEVARAFRLADGDVITLTNDLVEGEPAVDEIFEIGAGGKLVKSEDEGATALIKFKVREDAGYELTRSQKATRFDIVR